MKKWISAMVVLLGASTGFAGSVKKWACANEHEQKLDIVYDSSTKTVVADLTKNQSQETFLGNLLPNGNFGMKPSAANEEVSLELSKSRDHGGRCGRCGPSDPNPVINAKLVVGAQEHYFTCEQQP